MSDWPDPTPGGQGRSFDPNRSLAPTWRTSIRRWLGRSPNLEVLVRRLGRRRIRGRHVLLLGAGEAQESGFWAPYAPQLIVPFDYYPTPGVARFVAGNAGALPFRPEHFDVVASINAFEHFTDPEAVLLEIVRTLRPGGHLVASFGPLWWGLGGDHFSAMRAGLGAGLNHLLMDEDEHRRFVEHMTIEGEDLVDGRYVGARGFLADGFFSRWHADQYRELFEAHLRLRHFAVFENPLNAGFRRRWPDRWSAAEEKLGRTSLEANVIQVIGERR